jgi:uncharacterized protein
MKHFTLIILLVFAVAIVQAQSDNKITIGKTSQYYSKILGEQRKLWIYTPDINSTFRDTSKHYPVLYLLDGDANFESVVGMVRNLSQVNGNTVCPEMIIVGVLNTDRARDFTPTHISSDPPFFDSASSGKTGGGEKFVSFLEKELIPYIDSSYPTQPYKMLVGHSLGGLMVMSILVNHPTLFNSYICIDPSMWYDREKYLKYTQKKLSETRFTNTRLYLGIANTIPDGMTFEKMQKDTSVGTRHIRDILEMDKYIKSVKNNGLKYASKYYASDSHTSVPLITQYDGIRFIFDFYDIKLVPQDFGDTADLLARKYQKRYEIISKEFGYKLSPPEKVINAFGYLGLSQKHYTMAESLFKLNIANYPNSHFAFASYGDFFAAKKDTTNAIINYEKALSISENNVVRQKLAGLKGK